MSKENKEIAYRQAAKALLQAARDMGYDVDKLADTASLGIAGSQKYREAEHPHAAWSVELISELKAEVI